MLFVVFLMHSSFFLNFKTFKVEKCVYAMLQIRYAYKSGPEEIENADLSIVGTTRNPYYWGTM